MSTLDPVTGTATSDLSNLANPPAPAPASPTPPAPPAAPLEPLPAISRQEAESKMRELDPDFWTRYTNEDPEAIRQYRQIHNGLTTAPAAPAGSFEAAADELRKFAPTMSPELWDHTARNVPITPHERDLIIATRDALFADPNWKPDRDLEAREQYGAIISALMRPVRDNPQTK